MMTFREQRLYELLLEHTGSVLYDARLAAFLFGEDQKGMSEEGRLSLKQCMSRLRHKLPEEVLLVRVSKRGYALVRRGAT